MGIFVETRRGYHIYRPGVEGNCPPNISDGLNIRINFPNWEWALNIHCDDTPEGIPLRSSPGRSGIIADQPYKLGLIANLLTEFTLYVKEDGIGLSRSDTNRILDGDLSTIPFYGPEAFQEVTFNNQGITSSSFPTRISRQVPFEYHDHPRARFPMGAGGLTFHFFYGTRSFQFFLAVIPLRGDPNPIYLAYSSPFTLELFALFRPAEPPHPVILRVYNVAYNCRTINGIYTGRIPPRLQFPLTQEDADILGGDDTDARWRHIDPRPRTRSHSDSDSNIIPAIPPYTPRVGRLPASIRPVLRGPTANQRAEEWFSNRDVSPFFAPVR